MHKLTKVDLDNKKATCSVCGPGADLKVWVEGARTKRRCRVAARDAERIRTQNRPPRSKTALSDRQSRTNDWKKRGVNLTWEQYQALIIYQNNSCAICQMSLDGKMNRHVDHNHDTGEARGLLCNRCNRGLGFLKDDPRLLEAGALYLRNPPSRNIF